MLWRLGHGERLGCFWYTACVSISNAPPTVLRYPLSLSCTCLTVKVSLQLQQPSPQCGAALWSKWTWNSCSAWAGGHTGAIVGNWSSMLTVLIHPLHHAQGVSKLVCTFHKWVQTSHSSPISPSSPPTSQGNCLPSVRTQGWGAQYVALTAHSPGRFSARAISLLFWVPSQGTDHFSSIPVKFCVYL